MFYRNIKIKTFDYLNVLVFDENLTKSLPNMILKLVIESLKFAFLKLTVLVDNLFSLKSMSLAGKIVRFVWFSFDNCVSTSKVRIPSTSSPKNSIRKGSNWDISKISKMSPRILNSPCVCTWVTFRYPISFNRWSSSCWSYSSTTAFL